MVKIIKASVLFVFLNLSLVGKVFADPIALGEKPVQVQPLTIGIFQVTVFTALIIGVIVLATYLLFRLFRKKNANK
jgi:hypothetical protein